MKGLVGNHERIRRIIHAILFALVLLMIFVCFVGCVYIWLIIGFGERGEDDDIFTYRYLEVDSRDNSTHSGFLTSYDSLGPEGFKFTGDETGIFTLVSKFEDEEYACTGSCFCEEVERRSSVTLVKGVSYLVAAVSSVVAYDLAKKYFNEECQNRYEDKCTRSSIQSNIDECIPMIREDYDAEVKNEKAGKQRQAFVFKCKGKCLSYDVAEGYLEKFPEEEREKYRILRKEAGGGVNMKNHLEAMEEYNCEKHTLANRVLFQIPVENYDMYELDDHYFVKLLSFFYIFSIIQYYLTVPENRATAQFVTKNLDPFCLKTSTVNVGNVDGDVSMCAGYSQDHENPTVECVKTYERTMKKRWFFWSPI